MGNFRSFLYQLAKFLGDISAVSKGKTGKRIVFIQKSAAPQLHPVCCA